MEAVAERDIDLLILEVLTVSREFAQWFYQENHLVPPTEGKSKAFHSVSDAELGESDIVVLYDNGHAILIENKIGAIAQKDQARRYQQRGEKVLALPVLARKQNINVRIKKQRHSNCQLCQRMCQNANKCANFRVF